MSASPILEPAAIRYSTYIEELHEFFSAYGLKHGSPRDLLTLTRWLRTPGPFAGDFSLVTRFIISRENGDISRAQLLEVIAIAIGGPEMERAPREFQRSLSQLFAFLTTVRHRPLMTTDDQPAEVIPFPADSTAPPDNSPSPRRLLRPFHFGSNPAVPTLRTPLIIAGAVLLAISLFLIFFHHTAGQTDFRLNAPHPAVAAPAATSLAKPSPYGSAFLPPQAPTHVRHAAAIQTPQTTGQTDSQPPAEQPQSTAPQTAATPTQ